MTPTEIRALLMLAFGAIALALAALYAPASASFLRFP